MSPPVRAGLPAGISDFRLPVVSNDTLWKNHQQYWDSWPDPGCQMIQDVNYLYLVVGPFSLLACLAAPLSAFNLLLMCLFSCSS